MRSLVNLYAFASEEAVPHVAILKSPRGEFCFPSELFGNFYVEVWSWMLGIRGEGKCTRTDDERSFARGLLLFSNFGSWYIPRQ